MSGGQDYDLATSLSNVNTKMPIIFSYFVPWIGLAISIFATVVLLLRKRTEDNQSLLIYIFQWQYAIGIVFWLNMIFLDFNFTKNLFGYNLRSYVPDIACKLVPMICKFLYCSSPWIQVVITFDRLWCVYLESKFKIKRKRLTVTILILIVFGFVFLPNQVHLLYYQRMTATYIYVFNATLNKSVLTVIFVPICQQGDSKILLAQDMIHVIMRIVLPFIIMVICNVLLINHIRKSRKVAVSSAKEKKEQSFTIAVAIMNLSYLVCNIGVVVYYIMLYYYTFSGSILDIVPYYINAVFGTSAILFSYVFTLSQFFIDLIFNKVFRKVIFSTVLHLSGRENKVSQSDSGNHSQAQTQAAKKY